mgnify:CR=1 FL=1
MVILPVLDLCFDIIIRYSVLLQSQKKEKKLEYYHNAWNIITSAYPGGSDLKDKITKIMDGATSPEQKWQAYSIAMDNAIKAWNKAMSTRTNKQIKTM